MYNRRIGGEVVREWGRKWVSGRVDERGREGGREWVEWLGGWVTKAGQD